MDKHIDVPFDSSVSTTLKAGDYVYLTGTIYTARDGKGKRNPAVHEAIVRDKAVYFAAVGGAGALLSKCITSSEVIAYDDLGTEAVRKLTVKDFPVIVVIDSDGRDLYEEI